MSYFGGKQAMERMSSFERRISTQYTKSSHSVAAANQIDSRSRGVGPLRFSAWARAMCPNRTRKIAIVRGELAHLSLVLSQEVVEAHAALPDSIGIQYLPPMRRLR